MAFARRGGGFVASGGADKLLKVWWDEGVVVVVVAAWAGVRKVCACSMRSLRCAKHRTLEKPKQKADGLAATKLIHSIFPVLQVWDTKGVDLSADAKPAKLRVTAAVAAHDKDINAVAVAPNDSGVGVSCRVLTHWSFLAALMCTLRLERACT